MTQQLAEEIVDNSMSRLRLAAERSKLGTMGENTQWFFVDKGIRALFDYSQDRFTHCEFKNGNYWQTFEIQPTDS